MILKAFQRGGAKQLAIHLSRVDDNEHVEIHDMRGFISDNLTEALKAVFHSLLNERRVDRDSSRSGPAMSFLFVINKFTGKSRLSFLLSVNPL